MNYSPLPRLERLGVSLKARFAPFGLAFLLLAATASAQDRCCFVRPGDVWVFVGDSITHNDTYRRMVERVYHHYNPGANVRFPQAGRDGAPGLEMGGAADVILDITDGRRRNLYVIDLCRVPVLHLTDNKVSGVIEGDATRAEGKKAAEWTLSVVDGKWLSLEVEVFDSQICPENIWPWGQDGLTVWMDYRPATRFADIGVDADVYQAFLLPYEKPTFAVSLRPWLGRAVWGPAVAGGVKTATGYKVHLHVADQQGQFHRFSKLTDSDLSLRDFFAFDLVLCDQDSAAEVTAEFA